MVKPKSPKRQILRERDTLGIQQELNLGLKTEKQFQNKNHTEDLALGYEPRDDGHINY